MSDLTPYEKGLPNQLSNLPLPDVDKAWQDLKEMLDDDDNKGGGKIPSSNNRIGGISLLIALLSIGILWYAHSNKQPIVDNGGDMHTGTVKKDASTTSATTADNETQKTSPVTVVTENNTVYNKDASTKNKITEVNNINTPASVSSGNKNNPTKFPNATIQPDNSVNRSALSSRDKEDGSSKNNAVTDNPSTTGTKFPTIDKKKSRIKNIRSRPRNEGYANNNTTPQNSQQIFNKNKPVYQTPAETSGNNALSYGLSPMSHSHPGASNGLTTKRRKNDNRSAEPTAAFINDNNNGHPPSKGKLTVRSRKNPIYHIRNSAEMGEETIATDISIGDKAIPKVISDVRFIQPRADSLLKRPLVATKDLSDTTKKHKKQGNHKKTTYLAAGVGAQQSIDKSCNCAYPNNIPAKIMAKDYIPSVFLGFHDKKWFLQTEFNYAAPQYVNGVVYHAIQDAPLLLNDTTTTFTIKKIYGHQGSISFNYSIRSNLSIGTGLIYTIFSGADIEKTVQKKSYGPVDSLISSTMITDKEDSGFNGLAKNNFQLLLQVQYQWNRFSFGTSYSIGLTPYIKYTDPYSKMPAQKDNNVFNVSIKYALWKQR